MSDTEKAPTGNTGEGRTHPLGPSERCGHGTRSHDVSASAGDFSCPVSVTSCSMPSDDLNQSNGVHDVRQTAPVAQHGSRGGQPGAYVTAVHATAVFLATHGQLTPVSTQIEQSFGATPLIRFQLRNLPALSAFATALGGTVTGTRNAVSSRVEITSHIDEFPATAWVHLDDLNPAGAHLWHAHGDTPRIGDHHHIPAEVLHTAVRTYLEATQ